MGIWQEAGGKDAIQPMMAKAYRIVESQEEVATMRLVNTIDEQGLLEEMLESTKPPLTDDRGLHYLLSTPFRYPPLQYGSRFGAVTEASLFYASLAIPTALAETAYYRFVFMAGMAIPYLEAVTNEYTSFAVSVKCSRGVMLDDPPFNTYQAELTSPDHYAFTQQLGADMRRDEVEAFRYVSARDPKKGLNIGLFTPQVFRNKQPREFQAWVCQTLADEVGFFQKNGTGRFRFEKELFCVEGELPSPAT